ncbi:putative bifunctional diguanylate cyclase/phosphodiesterase [Rhodoferax sp.]|uniref:putative bifunctional diguanylate cyclase/phosphodiesterase n=1 Tax=Rhodoferax sp. TaxID=50421 RepID=UPI00386316A7
MSHSPDAAPHWSMDMQTAHVRLLHRFYSIFLFVGSVLLVIGVPFVFYRKAASTVAILAMIVAVLIAWRMNHRGQPRKSLIFFAVVMWLIMVALIYAGLTPTTAGVVVMVTMLAIVVHVGAAAVFGVTYMLAWLLYLVLRTADLIPAPYFPAPMISAWFVAAVAIGLVLLPIPELVLNLRKAASLQRAVIEAATDGVLVVSNDRKAVIYNQRFMDFWHLTTEYLNAHSYGDLLDHVSLRLIDPASFLQKVQEMYAHPDLPSFDTLRFKDGLLVERYSQPQRLDGQVVGRVWTFRDITERERADAEIRRLAFHDALTMLPNRRLFTDRLQRALTIGARRGYRGALLLIDLDNFKTLNDTLGHDKGDLLLQQVAQRLVASVRESDTVARLGGDEFVVMLEGLSLQATGAAAQAETVGKKILATLNQPYQLAEYQNRSTPSIGIALFFGHQTSIDELLKQADLAMYQSKTAGRNTLSFFDPAMQAIVDDRAALEIDLRAAVQDKQFLLHYQPQIIGGGHLTGAEVLVRWRHPQRGLVSPVEFIPLAEETGLILPLGLWVLETACAQLATWAMQPTTAELYLAVNVSANQLRQADFVDQVLEVLRKTGANPKRLKLELTESLLVSDLENTIAKMLELKAHGVGFSLDDFGTGYSSLSYLKRLPLDQLKIDQGFVRDILTDPNDASIAKMIIALADSLVLTVIAEGVEIEAQRDFLAGLGCHAYQGYLFSRPLPLKEFEAFMSQNEVASATARR